MERYAYIIENAVNQIIYAFSEDFPNIPMEERFSEEIIKKCVKCDESVKEGMDYDWETGKFSEHIEPEIVEEVAENEGNTEQGIEQLQQGTEQKEQEAIKQ